MRCNGLSRSQTVIAGKAGPIGQRCAVHGDEIGGGHVLAVETGGAICSDSIRTNQAGCDRQDRDGSRAAVVNLVGRGKRRRDRFWYYVRHSGLARR